MPRQIRRRVKRLETLFPELWLGRQILVIDNAIEELREQLAESLPAAVSPDPAERARASKCVRAMMTLLAYAKGHVDELALEHEMKGNAYMGLLLRHGRRLLGPEEWEALFGTEIPGSMGSPGYSLPGTR